MTLFDEPKIDAHCHVLDPARFPYASRVAYHPQGQEIAPVEQYLDLMPVYGIRRALFVGPNSGYGLDNRCLLDALARGRGRFKGIAFVANDTSDEALASLQAQGVIGIALNATVLGVDHVRAAAGLLQRAQALGLLLSLQVEHDQLVGLRDVVEASGIRVLVDHAGRPRASAGNDARAGAGNDARAGAGSGAHADAGLDQPGFRTLLAMARNGRTAVKLSGWQKFSTLPPPWPDTRPFVDALLDAFTLDACLWASDWPFLKAPQRLDVGPLVAHVARLLPDARDRRKLFWDTPCRWLGFDKDDDTP